MVYIINLIDPSSNLWESRIAFIRYLYTSRNFTCFAVCYDHLYFFSLLTCVPSLILAV